MHYDYIPIVDRQPLRWPNGARVALMITGAGGWPVRARNRSASAAATPPPRLCPNSA